MHDFKEDAWVCRGTLLPHPMEVEGPVSGFTPFHNVNCPQASLFFPCRHLFFVLPLLSSIVELLSPSPYNIEISYPQRSTDGVTFGHNSNCLQCKTLLHCHDPDLLCLCCELQSAAAKTVNDTVISLCKDCIDSQENCPQLELSLLRGATAVRMQWLFTTCNNCFYHMHCPNIKDVLTLSVLTKKIFCTWSKQGCFCCTGFDHSSAGGPQGAQDLLCVMKMNCFLTK